MVDQAFAVSNDVLKEIIVKMKIDTFHLVGAGATCWTNLAISTTFLGIVVLGAAVPEEVRFEFC